MSLQSRREYLERIRGRYGRAGREQKSRILDEFCLNCGYHRKHAVRLLTRAPRPGRKAGPPARYRPATVALLKECWLTSDQMCSKRLQVAAPDWLGYLRAPLSAKRQLLMMSPATMDRLLVPWRARFGRKRRSGTKPGSLLKKQIPIRTAHTQITGPGYLEADTVAHCGGSLSGDFIWTLTFTDVHSGWTQCRAVWNKGHSGIHQHLDVAERESPFPWKGFDWLNRHQPASRSKPIAPVSTASFANTAVACAQRTSPSLSRIGPLPRKLPPFFRMPNKLTSTPPINSPPPR